MKKEINYNKIDLFGTQMQVDLFGSIEVDKTSVLENKESEYVNAPNNLFDKQITISFRNM